jgi:hypothetical protein
MQLSSRQVTAKTLVTTCIAVQMTRALVRLAADPYRVRQNNLDSCPEDRIYIRVGCGLSPS